jgi:hydrogenase expression/formation protein HypD
MKYLDEFRDPELALRLIDSIRETASRRWPIMEVCGGQTHSLLRHGIDAALHDAVELIHGPGCPVCVTNVAAIDQAIRLASRPDVVLCCFGDMMRVPGSTTSLAAARAAGAKVRAVYSPLDAVLLAEKHPDRNVVMFAVGFETTVPATALAVLHAARRELKNFSLLVAHVRVQPAMEAILAAPDNQVAAFLAAGHVCTVVGYESYDALCQRYHVPVVVTGFEPVDLLLGLQACVLQLESAQAFVDNCYGRSAQRDGNVQAVNVVNEVYEICDSNWRGIGPVRGGGLRLKPHWRRFDAALLEPTAELTVLDAGPCRAGDVLSGRLKPPDCEAFGTRCTPDAPLGAPMVSSEGACAAYYRHHPESPRHV